MVNRVRQKSKNVSVGLVYRSSRLFGSVEKVGKTTVSGLGQCWQNYAFTHAEG